MARVLLRRLAGFRAVQRAAAAAERLDTSRPSILRVLTYHRVERSEPFTGHLQHLASRYQVVSAAQVIAALEGGQHLPRRSVLLTFDDGYRSFARVVWPILRGLGFPATLFVPTAFPDSSRDGFWWDLLAQAFRRTERRQPLATPLGLLPLATPGQRARARRLVAAYVKELPYREATDATRAICNALEVPPVPHDVLGWHELRELSAQGLTVGAHTRTHPPLDRIPRDSVREEVLGSLLDLEREIPGASRILAYPDGRHDDAIVEMLRTARAELAFTTRHGTNDLRCCDPLRLRRVNVDGEDSLAIFRARLAFAAARLEPLRRLLAPPSAGERRVERGRRSQGLRSRYVWRALDAVLTSPLAEVDGCPSGPDVAIRKSSRFERLRRMTRRAIRMVPSLEPALTRVLLSPERLPLRDATVELRSFGSAVTVYRLDPCGEQGPWALKVHRRTLGRDLHCLATAARGSQRRYRRLHAVFGETVLPARFLVLHAPLRGVPAMACLQPWLQDPRYDVLGLDDERLLALLGEHPALARSFAEFATRALRWSEEGFFPDLLGPWNLVAASEPAGLRLRLIDYGIFDRRAGTGCGNRDAALDAVTARLRTLIREGVSGAAVRR